ncbi:MAG: GGDEF and EAL domain-containing protein [Oscillospiraceae bacterium]|nr:GGDEF and EAL domain-containing protein [Oscillospiraceae bacterium]
MKTICSSSTRFAGQDFDLVKWRLIAGAVSACHFVLDYETDTLTFSQECLEIVALPSVEWTPVSSFSNVIFPDDLDVWLGALRRFESGQTPRLSCDFRLPAREGGYLWVRCTGEGLHLQNGKPLLLCGCVHNIAEELTAAAQGEMDNCAQSSRRPFLVDPLTGMPNRLSFYSDMKELMNQSIQSTIIIIDIKNFKNINDMYGHSLGDMMLTEFAALMRDKLPQLARLYRFGGDEFAAVWPWSRRAAVDKFAEEFLQISEQPLLVCGQRVRYFLSIGAACFPDDGRNVDELLKCADVALSKAKAKLWDGYSYFTIEDRNTYMQQLELDVLLHQSVENNFHGFQVFYQPIVGAKNRQCTGAEALLRWQTPDGIYIPPARVIPLLEKSGLISRVGLWVLETAVRQTSKWVHLNTDKTFLINVNLSAHQLLDRMLPERILTILDRFSLAPGNLSLEVTESSVINNMGEACEILQSLRNRGVRIALDDFGTGYSSLSHLQTLPIDEIKIDRSFLKGVADTGYNKSFVSTIVELAHSLQRVICAEGVEEQVQYQALRDLKVDKLQGYLFGRPTSLETFQKSFVPYYYAGNEGYVKDL